MLINLIDNCNGKIELDNGFFYGQGLFETILVLDKPIFLEEHLDRLNEGLLKLNIKKTINIEEILENLNNVRNSAVKITVTEKNTILSKREINYIEKDYVRGFNVSCSIIKRDEANPLLYLKSLNYMENFLEKQKANSEGYDEVLFFNNQNFLCEGSFTNVFVVMESCILTPDVHCGLLNGIVRTYILKNLGDKYNIMEGKISMENIKDCKGMFLTNSIMGVMKVNSFKGIELNSFGIIEEIRNSYMEYINN